MPVRCSEPRTGSASAIKTAAAPARCAASAFSRNVHVPRWISATSPRRSAANASARAAEAGRATVPATDPLPENRSVRASYERDPARQARLASARGRPAPRPPRPRRGSPPPAACWPRTRRSPAHRPCRRPGCHVLVGDPLQRAQVLAEAGGTVRRATPPKAAGVRGGPALLAPLVAARDDEHDDAARTKPDSPAPRRNDRGT